MSSPDWRVRLLRVQKRAWRGVKRVLCEYLGELREEARKKEGWRDVREWLGRRTRWNSWPSGYFNLILTLIIRESRFPGSILVVY